MCTDRAAIDAYTRAGRGNTASCNPYTAASSKSIMHTTYYISINHFIIPG